MRFRNLFFILLLGVSSIVYYLSEGITSAQENGASSKESSFHFNPSDNYLPTESKLNPVVFSTINEVRENFANPGVDFATAPLWVWNDLLTDEQIRSTLEDLNKQNVNMAFVHPRPGLATPYLSKDWFHLWDVTLDEAKKRGMKIWIYDENSYPSGFAGGFVPDAHPEYRGSGLDVVIVDNLVDSEGKWQTGDSVSYVVELFSDGNTVDRTAEVLEALKNNQAIPSKSSDDSRWIVGRIQLAQPSQWFGGKTYVNLMTKGVLDSFLGFTHEQYRQHFESEFGNLIPGVFTDEPQVASAGMFSWTDDFPEEFKKRRGYDIVPCIGSLIAAVGEWKQVRYDYYKTVMEVFVERWHKPLAEYCEQVGLEYTGHDWEHEWPNAHYCPDNMATAFWRQRPAIDLLMNQFARGTHSQFGNVRSVRELNSVVRQSGRGRSISENYGAGGYDIQFEDLKRLGDWSYALGVNTTCEHLSYITIRGARKHDHPQTFSYHTPWFEHYSKLEDYWTRLSYLLSRGTLSQDRFLLLEPTSTAWLYQHYAGDENNGKKDRIGNEFAELLNVLEAEQIDYDLGSEDVLERVGSVESSELRVGAANYKTIVLPSSVENLAARTVELLYEFVKNGGRVVSLDASLELVNGLNAERLDKQYANDLSFIKENWENLKLDEFISSIRQNQKIVVNVSANKTNVFHQIRETKDATILFVCNIDLDESALGSIDINDNSTFTSVEEFEPLSGTILSLSVKNNSIPFELKPCSSLTLVFSNQSSASSAKENDSLPVIRLTPQNIADKLTKVEPLDDNVLTLDYFTVKLGDEVLENAYFYRANNWFWNKKGFRLSPWDNGVQFKDELITRKFEDASGFELIYKFNKTNDIIDDLRFVVESPDLYKVYCNNQEVDRIPNAWKFDRSFGVYNIAQYAQPGVNEIKLVASESNLFCELMPAWVIGKFSLEPSEQGFTITSDKGITYKTDSDVNNRTLRASSELERVSWLTSGVGFSNNDDRSPSVSFQFKDPVKISAIRIWNYCEANLAKRGVKSFEMKLYNANGEEVDLPSFAKNFELKLGNGDSQIITLPSTLDLNSYDKLTFVIKSNWNGINYPLNDDFVGSTKPDNDNAFVGLAEVQFLDEKSSIQKPIVTASSELVFRAHERRARFLTDGSGLELFRSGWASQGRPFYAGAVDYQFELDPVNYSNKKTVVELPDRNLWRASAVVVLVDEKQVGVVGWSGDSVDVSSALLDALEQNKKTVKLTLRVYGTPKNLFGPHHAGKLRGSAWPGSFHQAPNAQPAGSEYDVIEYGLFDF